MESGGEIPTTHWRFVERDWLGSRHVENTAHVLLRGWFSFFLAIVEWANKVLHTPRNEVAMESVPPFQYAPPVGARNDLPFAGILRGIR